MRFPNTITSFQSTWSYRGAWRNYNGLLAGDFANHLAVNHSLHFVDPITHVHTNNIESHWPSLRHRLSRGGIPKDQMDSHIAEHLWHLDCKNRDPFQGIKAVYPVQ